MKSLTEDSNSSFLTTVQVVLLCAISLAFIDRPFWDDELFSIRTAASLQVLAETCRLYENNMVAYYAILAGWMQVFGDGEIAVRSLSLSFSVLAIMAFGQLSRRFFNPKVAGLSGLMLTLNPIFLYYSIEARGYSLLLLTAIVSTNLFFSLLQHRSRARLAVYVLMLSLSVYSHYFGLLILPVHAAFLILRTRSWPLMYRMVSAWIVVLILVSPLLIFKPLSTDQLYWMAPPTWRVLLKALGLLFGGTGFFAAYLLLFVIARKPARTTPKSNFWPLVVICSLWILIPLTVVFIFSVLVKPMFLYRYFIWILPASALLAGLLFRQCSDTSYWLAGLVGLLICAQVIPAYQMLQEKGSGYRDTVAFMVSSARKGDAVIAYPFFKADHYRYYLSRQQKSDDFLKPQAFHSAPYLPGGGGREPDPDWRKLDTILSGAERVWLICDPRVRETDQRLNRMALPSIEARIRSHFPAGRSYVFGAQFHEPTRVLMFSK